MVVLAAGYGTRLARDIEQDPAQTYKHLIGVPKPLVPIGICLFTFARTRLHIM